MKLNNEELMSINGGGTKIAGFGIILGGILTFLIGVIDGYLRPLKCN